MSTSKDSATSPKLPSDQASERPGLSLDWWAVLFAFILVTLVLAGLQVKW